MHACIHTQKQHSNGTTYFLKRNNSSSHVGQDEVEDGGGHWNIPLGGRESECSWLPVETVDTTRANSAVTFEETPTILIEATVEDNPGAFWAVSCGSRV